MKVYIGKYLTWWGPYQIANLLQNMWLSEDRCDKIGDYLSHTWLNEVCEWIESKRKRTIKIKIHVYDVWNLDHTLALIILPALKLLQKTRNGVPHLRIEDQILLPEVLRYKPEDYDEHEMASYESCERQWDWIMGEMIFAFENILDNDNYKNDKVIEARVDNGLKLFGQFFKSLWD